MEQSQKLAKKMRFVTVFMLAENLDRKPSRKNGGDWPRLRINRDSGRWQLSCCANVVQKCLLVRSNVLNGTPTKRQVSKRQVSKRDVSFTKRQVYKTSDLQNVRFPNVWFQNVQFLNFIYLLNKKYRNCQVCIAI